MRRGRASPRAPRAAGRPPGSRNAPPGAARWWRGFDPESVGQWPCMAPAPSAQLPPRYTNPRPLTGGAMGEIILVDDTMLGRPVVLKLLAETYARDQLLRRRFVREANAAARLSGHPHVVTIYDVGEWDGRTFIAMEYLPNGD